MSPLPPDRSARQSPAVAPPRRAGARRSGRAASGRLRLDAESPPRRGSPWVLAIVLGLLLMALVNFAFIYIAVSDADQIVPSYQLEHR